MKQKVVLVGYWKASILTKGALDLLSEAVSPGFVYRDMGIATHDQLKSEYPHIRDEIRPCVKYNTDVF